LAWLHLYGPLNAPRGDYDHLRPAVARAIFAALLRRPRRAGSVVNHDLIGSTGSPDLRDGEAQWGAAVAWLSAALIAAAAALGGCQADDLAGAIHHPPAT
jgi:hypothetical protein